MQNNIVSRATEQSNNNDQYFLVCCRKDYSFACTERAHFSSLGPVSLCPGCTSALGLLCNTTAFSFSVEWFIGFVGVKEQSIQFVIEWVIGLKGTNKRWIFYCRMVCRFDRCKQTVHRVCCRMICRFLFSDHLSVIYKLTRTAAINQSINHLLADLLY